MNRGTTDQQQAIDSAQQELKKATAEATEPLTSGETTPPPEGGGDAGADAHIEDATTPAPEEEDSTAPAPTDSPTPTPADEVSTAPAPTDEVSTSLAPEDGVFTSPAPTDDVSTATDEAAGLNASSIGETEATSSTDTGFDGADTTKKKTSVDTALEAAKSILDGR